MKVTLTALALTGAFASLVQAQGIPKLGECNFPTHAVCQWTGRIPQATVIGLIVTRTCSTNGNIPGRQCECTVGGSVKDKRGLIVLKLLQMRGATKCVP